MHILVSGGNGQLGSEFKQLKAFEGAKLIVLNKSALDISKASKLRSAFKKYKPKFFINTAAYTKVDLAEDEIQKAYDINANALIAISDLCNQYNTCLIHYSTDYVYNQKQKTPLTEKSKTNPKGVYAESKHAGEKNIQALCDNYIIMRTSWVYSRYGKNFVDTMLRLAKSYDTLKVVSDQIGAPTYARDLAVHSLEVIKQLGKRQALDIQEIYNYSNKGVTNWAEFAKKIFQLADKSCLVQKISTKEFNARAYRPLWSVLSTSKIREEYKLDIPLWEDSLNDYLSSTGNIPVK